MNRKLKIFATAMIMIFPGVVIADDYDPIPPAWSIKIGLPGLLSVGAQYCTQSGKCTVVGSEIEGFTVGGSKIGGIQGCQMQPDLEPCETAKIPVEVLAMSKNGSAIIRLNNKNYGVGGNNWYKKRQDGEYNGGPILVISNGIRIPLHMYKPANRE